MGSFNGFCGLTNTPIQAGDPVVMLALDFSDVKPSFMRFSPIHAGKALVAIHRGEYNSYGSVEGLPEGLYEDRATDDSGDGTYLALVHERAWALAPPTSVDDRCYGIGKADERSGPDGEDWSEEAMFVRFARPKEGGPSEAELLEFRTALHFAIRTQRDLFGMAQSFGAQYEGYAAHRALLRLGLEIVNAAEKGGWMYEEIQDAVRAPLKAIVDAMEADGRSAAGEYHGFHPEDAPEHNSAWARAARSLEEGAPKDHPTYFGRALVEEFGLKAGDGPDVDALLAALEASEALGK